MRLILQRVAQAAVEVGAERVGAIGRGLLVLAGIEPGGRERPVAAAAAKVRGLRIFDDERGRMNLDVAEAGGEVLVVSQFTLLASTDRGRRPAFTGAARPEVAEPLVARLADELRRLGLRVETGRFGAHMLVSLVNEGPVTIPLDFPPGPAHPDRS
jgi:D-tyrosyl-tRNA(Tyr) deacylase